MRLYVEYCIDEHGKCDIVSNRFTRCCLVMEVAFGEHGDVVSRLAAAVRTNCTDRKHNDDLLSTMTSSADATTPTDSSECSRKMIDDVTYESANRKRTRIRSRMAVWGRRALDTVECLKAVSIGFKAEL